MKVIRMFQKIGPWLLLVASTPVLAGEPAITHSFLACGAETRII